MIYISSSWKNRDSVRRMAQELRRIGLEPYDFTDERCRNSPEIPPERFPDQFDPARHEYGAYIGSVPEWRRAVEGNRAALDRCDAVVLLLPCGNDAHADAYYALGRGKRLIVCGQPEAGDRTPTHMWAEAILPDLDAAVAYLKQDQTRDEVRDAR